MVKKIIIIISILTICTSALYSQDHIIMLISKMRSYEFDIQNTYKEYQKIYYESKSSTNELRAFEDLISVYVSQIIEIYETVALSNSKEISKARDIASRSLIFRSLTYLEKAPLNIEFFEKACYDYYAALEMYEGIDEIPIILKPLTLPITVTNVEYKRLIDLIEKKGKELQSFGKIKVTLKNFKIISNLNSEIFEFVRLNSPYKSNVFTYSQSEIRIKKAFRDVLNKNEEISFFLALPEGSYTIRSKSNDNPLYSFLSTVYVRSNQRQEYIIEPLLDWVIVYENSKTKRPDFDSQLSIGGTNGGNGQHKKLKKEERDKLILKRIDELITAKMSKIDISKIFNLRDPWIRSRFSKMASEIITVYISGKEYFNCWNEWMLSWEISCAITEKFSPGTIVPTELVILVNQVLKEL